MIRQRNTKKLFLELNQKLNHLMVEKNFFMKKKKNAKIGINTDHDLFLNKQLKFPMLTVIIKSAFQEGEKYNSK